MDKYSWERIRLFLPRDEWLSQRETSRFHITCDWFGLGWTVVRSPLVHVLHQLCWDDLSFLLTNILDRSTITNFFRRCDVDAGAREKVTSCLAEGIAHIEDSVR